MRLTRKLVAKGCITFVVLLATTALLCLTDVDYTPYFRSAYYTQTIDRLNSQLKPDPLVPGEVSAGFGRAVITPTLNAPQDDPAKGQFRSLPLAGYGNRQGKPATGVHDDICVKAAAIRVGGRLGVMVGADALIIPREVADAVAEKLKADGLDRAQIYLSASHTHCGIGGWGEGFVGQAFAGGFQPGARTWFADRIVTAVRAAIADLQPAEFGSGRFNAPEFVRNRVVGKLGQVDPEFSYIVLKQKSGKIGVLGSYSAHATVLSGRMMEFSADYPGFWQRAVEEKTGGFAVFLGGGVGSHAPTPPEGGMKGADQMGRSLAAKVLAELPKTALTNSMVFDFLGLDVALPPTHVRLTDGIRLRPWLAKQVAPLGRDTFLQAFRLRDCIWISTPCDFSGELALGIKDSFRPKGMNVVVTSFNGDYIGYVILPRYYHLDGYEPRVMSFYGPWVPDYLDDLIRMMASGLAKR